MFKSYHRDVLSALLLFLLVSNKIFSQTEDTIKVGTNKFFGLKTGFSFGIANHHSPALDINPDYRIQFTKHIGVIIYLGASIAGGVNKEKYDEYIRKTYNVPSAYQSPKVDGINEFDDLYALIGLQYSIDINRDHYLDFFVLGGYYAGGTPLCDISYKYNNSFFSYHECFTSCNYSIATGLDYRIKLNKFTSFIYRAKVLYSNFNLECEINQWGNSRIVPSETINKHNQHFYLGFFSAGITFTIFKRLPYKKLSKEYIKNMNLDQ